MLQALSRDKHNMGPTGEEAGSGGIREHQGQELQLASGLWVVCPARVYVEDCEGRE